MLFEVQGNEEQLRGTAETEVEPTVAAEEAEAIPSPYSSSLPFSYALTPGQPRDLRGNPPVHRPISGNHMGLK